MLHFHQTYRNTCHGFLWELKILLHFLKREQLNFCITEPYLLICCWKNLFNRTIMVLEEVYNNPKSGLSKLNSCQTLRGSHL